MNELLPAVEGGIVCAWPCPRCSSWRRPSMELCGCYVCTGCNAHVPPEILDAAIVLTVKLARFPSRN